MKPYLILLFILIGFITQAKETLAQKVIYSEASPLVASDYERYLIVSVIKNRIEHKAFSHGKYKTINDVIKARGAFTSYKHKNVNWYTSKCPKTLNKISQLLNKKPYPKITMYHDKSIKKPSNWKNVIKVCETENFVFYKIKG